MLPYNRDKMKALKDKHMFNPLRSMLNTLFLEAPLMAKVDIILSCIKLIHKGISCGRDVYELKTYYIVCIKKVPCGKRYCICNHYSF